ncbi:MAG: hypothetical protein ACREJC_19700 [Tepidisphaeraceae bacterium]
MSTWIENVDAVQIAAALATMMILAWTAGWFRGRWTVLNQLEPADTKADDASLALMGLLLAFTFSMALNKHDHRRAMLVADCNAIGDFSTCASMIDEPQQSQLRDLLRDYVQQRVDLARQGPHPGGLEEHLRFMASSHARMTQAVREAISRNPPVAVPLVNTLNGLTSSHTALLASVRDRLPISVLGLLVLATVAAAGLLGRQQGASPRSRPAHTVCFIALVSFALYITLDLNQPTRGLIRLNAEPLERLLDSMKK